MVPRAGGTGLTDGAVPLRGGILVDVKLMNRILEIDVEDRTVTVQPGINMLKLSEELRPLGFIYPDDQPHALLPGGRAIGTNGWSLIGGRYSHTRDLVISFQMVLPTGEIIEVGDGGGRKIRKSSSGYQLKHLFMGHQGTLGIVTEATLELVTRPEAEFAAFFSYPDYETAWRSTGALARSGLATLAGVVLFDEWKIDYLRRDDEAYIPSRRRRGRWSPAMCRAADEVRPGQTPAEDRPGERRRTTWATRSPRATGPRGTTATPRRCTAACQRPGGADELALRGRVDQLQRPPGGAGGWHAIVEGLRERHDMFDDWGMFAYTNRAYKPWGDYLTEIDVGIWEERWDEDSWAAWVDAKREIAAVALRHGAPSPPATAPAARASRPGPAGARGGSR